jgi:SRSO17 transposase
MVRKLLAYNGSRRQDAVARRGAMERRFRARLDELLRDAQVPPRLLHDAIPRLESFLQPFVASLSIAQQQTNTQQYIQGLLSNLGAKNAEAIAYLHDRERQGLQKFLGQSPWDEQPLFDELARQVAAELGEADGVLVFDPSAFAKKGTESVGVQRQWCGRLGKVENCQVGIYLGYVSRREHALVDVRLYLPREWTRRRQRMAKAGVPKGVRFRTRHELILEMLDVRGATMPHRWISGDDELGRSSSFRRELQGRREHYLLAVPSNTLVRDLAAPEPAYDGHGRRPQSPFVRVDRWCAAVPEAAWQTIEVRDGEAGPIVVQAVVRRLVQARTVGRPAEVAEQLVVFRERQGDGTWKHDYLLANAWLDTPLTEFARVFKAQHRIEECLKRAKSEAGLAEYQVRTWNGWHHHQALSLIATWFLTQETRRGKKMHSGLDGTAGPQTDRPSVAKAVEKRPPEPRAAHHEPLAEAKRRIAILPLEATQPLATTTA